MPLVLLPHKKNVIKVLSDDFDIRPIYSDDLDKVIRLSLDELIKMYKNKNIVFNKERIIKYYEQYEKLKEESMEYFYFPKYIPVGFEVMEEISNDMTYYIRFEKEDLYFCISQRLNSENRTFCIDTEDSVIIDIEFDGKKGFYSEKEGKQSIYLNTGRISINIYGNIGKKELFRMAGNLELLKR